MRHRRHRVRDGVWVGGVLLPTGGGTWGGACSLSSEKCSAPAQKIFDIQIVGSRAFWWYYFAHVYIWGQITKSNWLAGLGGQNFFHPQGRRHSPISPLSLRHFSINAANALVPVTESAILN